MLNLTTDNYVDNYNWELKADIAYLNYQDQFYVIGNNTSEEDAEDFTAEEIMGGHRLKVRLRRRFALYDQSGGKGQCPV